MLLYIARRLAHAIIVVWGAATLVFAILNLAPGDPAVNLVGENATEEKFEMVRQALGLNLPLHERYLNYLGDLLRGDLGVSWFVGQPVFDLLMDRLPSTIELTIVAALLCLPFAIVLGVVSALFRRTFVDFAANFVALFGISTPNFWLGVMLILLFAVNLHWLPSMGRGPGPGDVLAGLAAGDVAALQAWASHIILPAFTLGTFLMALVTRLTRTDILENLNKPYVKVARAKGMSPTGVITRHVLPNSMISVVTFIGLEVGALLGGAVVTESIFAWPGLGRLMIDSIMRRDFPVIQGGVLLVSFIFVFVNLLVDLLYLWLDPRIRLR
ncbi:ABC transporter permease [Acuticoccus mangrovi]|uniref:ABC transporter permease n=1 Tax=Acuticoccus mangrovi TaxID=2796142 RepID=A0A934MGE4_9HYPH|nr:ABC transporter permease [Acuticoccus mangrovi]MBJ3776488.1 ABC transporter permease [Acuticoccus mangrovi]